MIAGIDRQGNAERRGADHHAVALDHEVRRRAGRLDAQLREARLELGREVGGGRGALLLAPGAGELKNDILGRIRAYFGL